MSRRAGFEATINILLATLGAPWLAHYQPNQQILSERLQPPSSAHWLGADHLGRDRLARLLYGGRS